MKHPKCEDHELFDEKWKRAYKASVLAADIKSKFVCEHGTASQTCDCCAEHYGILELDK